MGQHWSHLTPTKRIQLDAFIRAGMKPTDIAKELGVHHTTIYRELKRCTYEHLNSDYTTETRYNSITCDNGCEFADAAGIERSASGKGARTEVYYCHPYRPSERGSNENQNGLIRRHVPKGTDLSTISDEETKRIEAWLNNYPRKMFGYLCSEQLFREEMALILAS